MKTLLFRYLAARWKHPGADAKRYIGAGFGLERRAQALSTYWTDHQSRTRAAQARWAKECGGKVLTVLGAGPLLDFNAAALAPKFERFRLVDANPLAASAWGRLNKPVEPVITDITNCLSDWARTVKNARGTWQEKLGVIRKLGQAPVEAYSTPTDALLSLNILSQLEIGWQEIVEPILQKRFGKGFVLAHEQEWLDAIRPGSQMLIEQHLAALAASRARHILLISDLEYVEYTGRSFHREQWAEPPLRWTDDGWSADGEIRFEVFSALEGVVLGSESFGRWMPGYEPAWHESWLWHIAPNGTEGADYGKLHRVGAFALRYRDSAEA